MSNSNQKYIDVFYGNKISEDQFQLKISESFDIITLQNLRKENPNRYIRIYEYVLNATVFVYKNLTLDVLIPLFIRFLYYHEMGLIFFVDESKPIKFDLKVNESLIDAQLYSYNRINYPFNIKYFKWRMDCFSTEDKILIVELVLKIASVFIGIIATKTKNYMICSQEVITSYCDQLKRTIYGKKQEEIEELFKNDYLMLYGKIFIVNDSNVQFKF